MLMLEKRAAGGGDNRDVAFEHDYEVGWIEIKFPN